MSSILVRIKRTTSISKQSSRSGGPRHHGSGSSGGGGGDHRRHKCQTSMRWFHRGAPVVVVLVMALLWNVGLLLHRRRYPFTIKSGMITNPSKNHLSSFSSSIASLEHDEAVVTDTTTSLLLPSPLHHHNKNHHHHNYNHSHDKCPNHYDPTTITTWEHVQQCINGFPFQNHHQYNNSNQPPLPLSPPPSLTKNQNKIKILIRLVGERHSGTKFIIGVIRQCFRSFSFSSSSSSSSSSSWVVSSSYNKNNYNNNNHTQLKVIVDANRDFTRSKHFFQVPPHPPNHPRIIAKKYRYDDHDDPFLKVIVIAVVRNPYDWVHAMIQQPYHAPYHVQSFQSPSSSLRQQQQQQTNDEPKTTTKNNDDEEEHTTTTTNNNNNNSNNKNDKNVWPIPLPWQEYVQRPWTIPYRTRMDQDRLNRNDTHGHICTLGMTFDEVTPCEIRPDELPKYATYREHVPIYELPRRDHNRYHHHRDHDNNNDLNHPFLKRKDNSEPLYYFDHILQLRAAKIRHWIYDIPSWNDTILGGYLVVRYDDLLQYGTEPMLRQVSQIIHGLVKSLLPVDSSVSHLHHQHQQQQSPPDMVLPQHCHPKGPQPERIGRRQIPTGLRDWIRQHMDVEAERLVGYDRVN